MRIVGAIALALAGAATAALLVVAPAAAWSITNLPSDCHTEGQPYDSAIHEYVVEIRCNGTATIIPYGTQAPPAPADDGGWQGALDAFVAANSTAPITTTAPTTTTAAPATTAVTAPVAPPVTTTVTQTVTQPAAGTEPASTTTYITVTTATPVETNLQAQIDALAAQIAALTDRVTRLEKAGDASWLAFEQAIAGGATIADAAEQARGTWLNVVNQLGAFAPTP